MKTRNKILLAIGGIGVATLGYLGYKKYTSEKVEGEIIDTDLTISKDFSEVEENKIEESCVELENNEISIK